MSLSRCIFVYCEQLKKGFVTRLTQEQKFDKIYEQATELFLKGTEFEVQHIELLDARPSVDWIVPPFFRIKDFGDLSFDDAIYVRAVLQPRTNEERRSEIRSTATYKRSKGASKRKTAMNVNGEEDEATHDAHAHMAESTVGGFHAKVMKKSDPAEAAAQQPVPEKSPPPPTITEQPETTSPVVESTAAAEKKDKPVKRRTSKGSKAKVKVSKNVEPPEKKQKLKQATLTPSSRGPDETQTQMEATKEHSSGEKAKKTPPAQETPKKVPQPDENEESTSEESTSSDEGTASDATDNA